MDARKFRLSFEDCHSTLQHWLITSTLNSIRSLCSRRDARQERGPGDLSSVLRFRVLIVRLTYLASHVSTRHLLSLRWQQYVSLPDEATERMDARYFLFETNQIHQHTMLPTSNINNWCKGSIDREPLSSSLYFSPSTEGRKGTHRKLPTPGRYLVCEGTG